MEFIAVIQYILPTVQPFGSQDYCNKFQVDLSVYYSAKMSRRRQNGSSFVPKKIPNLREAGEVSKQQ